MAYYNHQRNVVDRLTTVHDEKREEACVSFVRLHKETARVVSTRIESKRNRIKIATSLVKQKYYQRYIPSGILLDFSRKVENS